MSRFSFAILPILLVSPSSPSQCHRDADADACLEKCLNSPISVDFQETPFREVIACLRYKFRLPIVVDRAALAEEDLAAIRPLTVKLDEIRARSVLHLTLHQMGLAWIVEDGKIVVTTKWKAQGAAVWQSYFIEDVLLTEADHVDERWSDCLVRLIVNSVQNDSWETAGGNAQIEYDPDCMTLTIYQTRDGQEQIQDLFDAIRRQENPELILPALLDR